MKLLLPRLALLGGDASVHETFPVAILCSSMSEPKFPSSDPLSPAYNRLDAELKARAVKAASERSRRAVEEKWSELLTPDAREEHVRRQEALYQKRWERVRTGRDISYIFLSDEQRQDVLALLGMEHLPEPGEYLIYRGAKFSVSKKAGTCYLKGYHHSGEDLAEVVKRIRARQSIKDGAV